MLYEYQSVFFSARNAVWNVITYWGIITCKHTLSDIAREGGGGEIDFEIFLKLNGEKCGV